MDFYDPEPGYLDTQYFREFTVAVYDAIGERTSIGDIRRVMAEQFNDRMIWDAISALESVGKITRLWGVPSRYSRNLRPVSDGKGVLPGPAAPNAKTTPVMPESSRRILA
jgi:hypothetical protein